MRLQPINTFFLVEGLDDSLYNVGGIVYLVEITQHIEMMKIPDCRNRSINWHVSFSAHMHNILTN